VVIRVPLEMKHHKIAINVITVPGVTRLATLVLAIFFLLPQQAIVFYVIRAGQLPPCEDIVNDKKWNQYPTECNDETEL